jgi:mRNA interferase MazF
MTFETTEADFRITIDPGPETGLRVRSQLMADKPVTIRHERIRRRIGRLGAMDVSRLNVALALVMGLGELAPAVTAESPHVGSGKRSSIPTIGSV